MWSLFMFMTAAVMLPATSSAEPTRPNITRHQFFSSALTGLVAIGVNKSNTIWCSARNRVMSSGKLRSLHWLYSNRIPVPAVDKGQSSDHDVYMERYAGSSDQDNAMWLRVLHFKRTKPSSAGNYTCVASYQGNRHSHQTVDIRVSDIDCGDPGTPTNGHLHPFSIVYTSEVFYFCSMGYTLQGSDRRTCLSSGQWSGHLPQCKPVECGDPGTPTNGQRSLSSTTYNSVVTYTCDVGYTLQGANSRTCQSDGEWSGHLPQCNPVECGDPGTPTNGQHSLSSTTYNSVVTYTCDVGYTLQGANSRTCQSSQQWSEGVPQCNAVNCGDPVTPTNGQSSLSRTAYNSVVTYTCDVGYTLQGSNSRTCQSDGQWSGSVPQCTFVASIYSSSALTITLPLDSKARSGASFTVWYSTDGHDRDPSTPPQGAPMLSTGLNSTSVTIPLPESDNSCKPYYVWIAGNTPNGQQGPYSERRQVEVCKAYRDEHETMNTEQSTCGAASAGATVAGSVLGGAVVGGVVALLVVGILCGSWKLKHSGGGKSCEVTSEKEEKTYDTIGPKESTEMCDHVAMETNPAYGMCS